MNLKKFIGGVSALAIAASAFAAMTITASAADLALGISMDGTTGVTTIAHNKDNNANTSVSNDDISVTVNSANASKTWSTSFGIDSNSSIVIVPTKTGKVTIQAKSESTGSGDTTITVTNSLNETIVSETKGQQGSGYPAAITFKANENETYTVKKTDGNVANIGTITFKEWTKATISDVQAGKWYTYDEASGNIINVAPTEDNPVAAKANYVDVTPGDDTVTSVTVTYNSQYIGNGQLSVAGATVSGNNASITKDGLNLTGSGSVRVGILVTTTNAFNGYVKSISGTNFNQVKPTITVQ